MGKEIPPIFPQYNSNKKIKIPERQKINFSYKHCYLGIDGVL